jgi:hypothetical protein
MSAGHWRTVQCGVAACKHQVHVEIGKICFRDTTGHAGNLRGYFAKEIRSLQLFSWFKNGQETLNDDQHSGKPSTSKTG